MEVSFAELKEKEIVNVFDGRKLGRIIDILFDGSSGAVRGIVVPGEKKIFHKSDDIFIPLDKLKKIGDDVILVGLQIPTDERYPSAYGPKSSGAKAQNLRVYQYYGENSYKNKNESQSQSNNNSFVRFRRIDRKKYTN